MGPRLRWWFASLAVIAGVALGFAAAPATPGGAFLGGLAGGAAATAALGVALRSFVSTRAWTRPVLRMGAWVGVAVSALFFWSVPLVRDGLALDTDPIAVDVASLAAGGFDRPRHVALSGEFDDALAIEHVYHVRTRSSPNSTYRSERRTYCRSPVLGAGRTVSVVTDECPPFRPRKGPYRVRFVGILYPACPESGRACREDWGPYRGVGAERLQQAGYQLDDSRGWFLLVGASPAGKYWGFPLGLALSCLAAWGVAVARLPLFGRRPRPVAGTRRAAGASASRSAVRAPIEAPPAGAAHADADHAVRADGRRPMHDDDDCEPQADSARCDPHGPQERLAAALAGDPDRVESLDLTAYWESYRTERPMRTLSSAIGRFERLTSLGLMWNALESLPDTLAQLRRLESLDLSGNRFEQLPLAIRGLAGLRTLAVADCRLTTLPSWIGELAQLASLVADGNAIETLPDSIAALHALQRLVLNGNALHALPGDWRGLDRLETLDLSRNALESLPASVLQLPALRHLRLAQNRLASLPDVAEVACTALEELRLEGNALSAWPPWLATLRRLETLHFGPLPAVPGGHTRLAHVPDSLGELHRLRELSLSLAAGARLPEAAAALPKVHTLWLEAADLAGELALPPSLKSLTLRAWAQASEWWVLPGRLLNLESVAIDVGSAAHVPDSLIAAPSLKSLTIRCRKLNDHQRDRIVRLRRAGCRAEVVLERSGRRIVV